MHLPNYQNINYYYNIKNLFCTFYTCRLCIYLEIGTFFISQVSFKCRLFISFFFSKFWFKIFDCFRTFRAILLVPIFFFCILILQFCEMFHNIFSSIADLCRCRLIGYVYTLGKRLFVFHVQLVTVLLSLYFCVEFRTKILTKQRTFSELNN